MRQPTWIAACLLAAALSPAHAALTVGPGDSYIRVVDVGPGLCAITETPDKHYFVYDAGHWQGKRCFKAAEEIIDSGRDQRQLLLPVDDN